MEKPYIAQCLRHLAICIYIYIYITCWSVIHSSKAHHHHHHHHHHNLPPSHAVVKNWLHFTSRAEGPVTHSCVQMRRRKRHTQLMFECFSYNLEGRQRGMVWEMFSESRNMYGEVGVRCLAGCWFDLVVFLAPLTRLFRNRCLHRWRFWLEL